METFVSVPEDVWKHHIAPHLGGLQLYALACTCKALRVRVDKNIRSRYRRVFTKEHGASHMMRYIVEHGPLFQLLFWGPSTVDETRLLKGEHMPLAWTASLLAAPSLSILEWLGPWLVRCSLDMIQPEKEDDHTRSETESALGMFVHWARNTDRPAAETAGVLRWLWRHECWPQMTAEPVFFPFAISMIWPLRSKPYDREAACRDFVSFLVQCGNVTLLDELAETEFTDLMEDDDILRFANDPWKLAIASQNVEMARRVAYSPFSSEPGNDNEETVFDIVDVIAAMCSKNSALIDLMASCAGGRLPEPRLSPQLFAVLRAADALAFFARYFGWVAEPRKAILSLWRDVLCVTSTSDQERRAALSWLIHETGLLTPELIRTSLWNGILALAFGTLLQPGAAWRAFTQKELDEKMDHCGCPAHRTARLLRDEFGCPDLRVTLEDVAEIYADFHSRLQRELQLLSPGDGVPRSFRFRHRVHTALTLTQDAADDDEVMSLSGSSNEEEEF